MRVTVLLAAAAAVLALAAAAGLVRHGSAPPEPLPPMVVDSAEQDLGPVPVGREYATVRVTNPAGVPRRVLGLSQGCAPSCCFGGADPGPVTVGPGETFAVRIELDVYGPGPFEARAALFLEDNGIREVPIRVRGTAVPAEGLPHDPPAGP